MTNRKNKTEDKGPDRVRCLKQASVNTRVPKNTNNNKKMNSDHKTPERGNLQNRHDKAGKGEMFTRRMDAL